MDCRIRRADAAGLDHYVCHTIFTVDVLESGIGGDGADYGVMMDVAGRRQRAQYGDDRDDGCAHGRLDRCVVAQLAPCIPCGRYVRVLNQPGRQA